MTRTRDLIVLAVVASVGAAGMAWRLAMAAQPPAHRTRFEFLVIESYDAQYLGDTPGHVGRGGGLGHEAPDIALGDPVFHDTTRVGKVSRLVWNEAKESLQVEFDPEPAMRIHIGDPFWIPVGGPSPRR